MTCMCGDCYCPSCGVAQGHDPRFEALVDVVGGLLGTEVDEAAEQIAMVLDRLSRFRRIADLLDVLVSMRVTGAWTPADVAEANRRMDAIRPCPEHGCWPDADVGCVECFNRELQPDNAGGEP